MKELTEEWVKLAEQDFEAAGMMLQMKAPLINVVCFHCQQCAEKYLKAWLQEYDIYFPRTHDLSKLLELCLPLDAACTVLLADLSNLSSHAVAARYPGASLTEDTAHMALSEAQRVRQFVRSKLNLS